MTKNGSEFYKRLELFLLKENQNFTTDDWTEILAALVSDLENKKSIEDFTDNLDFKTKDIIKNSLNK